MKHRPNPTFVLIAMTLFASQNLAQQGSSFFTRIEDSVARQQSGWALVKKTIVPKANIAFYKWKSRKSELAALVFVRESSAAATETLAALPDTLGEIKSTDRLLNLGDDNYSWKSQYNKAVGIDFRKGRIVVHVSGSSLSEVKLFAQTIANAIDAI